MTTDTKSASSARQGRRFNWQRLTPYWFLLPTFALLIALRYIPAVKAIAYSFMQWKGFGEPSYVGFENYIRLFQDRIFVASLGNMAIYTALRTFLILIMSFVGAELVAGLTSRRMQMFWQVVFVIPLIVPHAVVFLVWGFVYNTHSGIINSLLSTVGLESLAQPWLGQSSTALPSIILIGFPFFATVPFLILVSSLQSLPKAVLEASYLDGCNIVRRIWHIDLPLMRGPLTLSMILLVLEGIRVLLPQLILTGGGPGTSTESPANFLYRTAFQYGEFGYASAVGIIMLIIGVTFSFISIRLRYRGGSDVAV